MHFIQFFIIFWMLNGIDATLFLAHATDPHRYQGPGASERLISDVLFYPENLKHDNQPLELQELWINELRKHEFYNTFKALSPQEQEIVMEHWKDLIQKKNQTRTVATLIPALALAHIQKEKAVEIRRELKTKLIPLLGGPRTEDLLFPMGTQFSYRDLFHALERQNLIQRNQLAESSLYSSLKDLAEATLLSQIETNIPNAIGADIYLYFKRADESFDKRNSWFFVKNLQKVIDHTPDLLTPIEIESINTLVGEYLDHGVDVQPLMEIYRSEHVFEGDPGLFGNEVLNPSLMLAHAKKRSAARGFWLLMAQSKNEPVKFINTFRTAGDRKAVLSFLIETLQIHWIKTYAHPKSFAVPLLKQESTWIQILKTLNWTEGFSTLTTLFKEMPNSANEFLIQKAAFAAAVKLKFPGDFLKMGLDKMMRSFLSIFDRSIYTALSETELLEVDKWIRSDKNTPYGEHQIGVRDLVIKKLIKEGLNPSPPSDCSAELHRISFGTIKKIGYPSLQ